MADLRQSTTKHSHDEGEREMTKYTADDPEPTDEELLAGIIRGIDDWQSITSPELLAKYLNTAGVTPPKEDK